MLSDALALVVVEAVLEDESDAASFSNLRIASIVEDVALDEDDEDAEDDEFDCPPGAGHREAGRPAAGHRRRPGRRDGHPDGHPT